jgi:hypothetical protein
MVGFSTGFIEVLICQPLMYCKNATQQGLALTLDPRVLYRGLPVSLSATAILTALQMPLTQAVRTAFTGGKVLVLLLHMHAQHYSLASTNCLHTY